MRLKLYYINSSSEAFLQSQQTLSSPAIPIYMYVPNRDVFDISTVVHYCVVGTQRVSSVGKLGARDRLSASSTRSVRTNACSVRRRSRLINNGSCSDQTFALFLRRSNNPSETDTNCRPSRNHGGHSPKPHFQTLSQSTHSLYS